MVLGGSPEEGKVALVAAVEPGHGLEAPQLVSPRRPGWWAAAAGAATPSWPWPGAATPAAWTRHWRPSAPRSRGRPRDRAGQRSPAEGRVLGVDLGSRRVGLAISDSDRRVASALSVLIRGATHAEDHARLASVLAETGANLVVVGLPLSLSGGPGRRPRRWRRRWASCAGLLPCPVELCDERFSTVVAHRSLRAAGRKAPARTRSGRQGGGGRPSCRRGSTAPVTLCRRRVQAPRVRDRRARTAGTSRWGGRRARRSR